MRFLKQLQLQGYKTFAGRTEFVFDVGVTAIVGPNGSGKSNIADGLRWVLGEQSFGTLRGKRTEDMIFSGSDQRARLGMAHVSLTFDNSTGWLPIDFGEVEVARRAYRSGDNEYYLNGTRVRLRDITELFGSSGLSERTYSVIGQGLIDQALSQRPDERRRLFEEAAGITVHQSKREQALTKLAEARANLTRAQDIMSELTPRLRYLKGQARRAQEYQQVRTELNAQLRIWYGYRWQAALRAIEDDRGRLAEQVSAADEHAESLNRLLEYVAARRTEGAQLRDALSGWHRESGALHRQAETVQRELAVRSEQLRLWGEQQSELEVEIVHLRAVLEDGAERLAAAEADLADGRSASEARHALVAAAQAALEVRQRERSAQAKRLTGAQDALLALKTQHADRSSRLGQAGERRNELARSQEELTRAAEAASRELRQLDVQNGKLEERIASCVAELAAFDQAHQTQSSALTAAQTTERSGLDALSAAQRDLARLRDQQDMLSRLREEGAGLNAGARAVLAVARTGSAAPVKLQGVVGTFGELIEVPPELERAIEAALGGRLQDVVVRRWEDAEAAVEYLKVHQGGRATFLPLDSLRPGRPAEMPQASGILGRASQLVKFDPSIRPAVELALNNILVVQDLPTARRLLGSQVHATLVTVDGEIVRPGGSVTGGSDSSRRDSGLLGRARGLRELPGRIRAASATVAERDAEVRAARELQAGVQRALDALRHERDEKSRSHQSLSAEKNRLQLATERGKQALVWHAERRSQILREVAELEVKEAQYLSAMGELSARLEREQAGVESARRGLAELALDDLVAEQARMRAEADTSAARVRNAQARVSESIALQQQRTADIAAKQKRLDALIAQQAVTTQFCDEESAGSQELASQITALAEQIDPAEARLAELEHELKTAESEERAARERLRQAQLRQSQAELTLQRAADEVSHLREEIEKELGPVELEGDLPVIVQQPLPLEGAATRLPIVVAIPDGLDGQVRAFRAQLGRLGPVNMDALVEYNEVEARYNFLTAQSTDLEKAAATLEEVIVELEHVMDREFQKTFKAVAAYFREAFTDLFGGGSARLSLVDPDNPNTSGVEIIARPPGKREQGLALLSGGERALTAVALIFSILKAHPTPFCVLDEVDAALDEANVGRFRDALKQLSAQTQFILITHNRGTIEAADTIYGISMGADNTSQVISLKLDGREVVTAQPTEAG